VIRLSAFLPILLAAATNCGSTSSEPAPDPELRLLFIGNSLTSANDLPGLVLKLAREDPGRTLRVKSIAYGGYSLEDHWVRGDAQRAIAEGGWDLVLLQQGPSALPESRVLLLEYARRFAGEIRRVGARPAIYMVWPELAREADWDAVTASYAAAAEAVDGVLLPAGEAIRAARAGNPALELFDADEFHPSLAGSYAAALVIYARAAGVSPVGLTLRSGAIELPAGYAGALEAAAKDALTRFPGP
jgi:hypothetical protein